jgi:hypothetical protein
VTGLELRLTAAAGIRSFLIGLSGVLLGIHLARLGLSSGEVGLVIAGGLAGNAVATALVAYRGDRTHVVRSLLWIACLQGLGFSAMAVLDRPPVLVIAAFLGLINGMGRDRGPGQTLEQSLLTRRIGPAKRTGAIARYTAAQDVAGGLGSLAAGLPDFLGGDPVGTARMVLGAAAVVALGTAALYLGLSLHADELPDGPVSPDPGVRGRVRGLASLFALDSLGGGFLASSILSYWFFRRFDLAGDVTGPLFLAARALNAGSYFVAERLASRIGLIRTMVFTHLPSSALLLVLPITESAMIAVSAFLLREALVQMDVPARQAYVAAVTPPEHRTYALGVTGLVRNVGWAVGPALAGWSIALLGLGAPLILGAGLKMVYDVALFRSYAVVREEF